MRKDASVQVAKNKTYWRSFCGIPLYKIDWYVKKCLYCLCGFTFDKMKDQRRYWNTRGIEYYDEFLGSNYATYERFFQDLLVEELQRLHFESIFEAGCGFGWNVKRIKQEFPSVRIGGLDFSIPQLINSRQYMPEITMPVACGDVCRIPFKSDSFDIGFTMGVFMNVHPGHIAHAIDELIRVSRHYIVHVEWDEHNTTRELRQNRVFKTNIVSHDYRSLYEQRGKKIIHFLTYHDFQERFFARFPSTSVTTWQQFEGPEKYICMVVEL